MDWTIIFAICFYIFYLIGMNFLEKKQPIKDVKKSAFVIEVIHLIWSIVFLCLHCYWHTQTWIIVVFVLCVLDAIYKIWCLFTPFEV